MGLVRATRLRIPEDGIKLVLTIVTRHSIQEGGIKMGLTRAIRRRIPEDGILHSHRRENRNS
jgi:hypothetical protein